MKLRIFIVAALCSLSTLAQQEPQYTQYMYNMGVVNPSRKNCTGIAGILLGTPEKLNQRLNNYKAFYQKALKDKSLENYQKIVLKYDNQVVCER